MRQLVFLLFFYVVVSATLVAQPKLEIAGGPNKDFGDVYAGLKKITRPVTLRNAGNETLNISKVEATCGCTAALLSSQHVAPNDSALVSITFNIGSYRGKIGKNVRVLSNDTSSPTTYINFSVNVLDVIAPTPQFLYFNVLKIDSPATKTFRLKNVTSAGLTILRVTSKDPQLTILHSPKKKLTPGEETKLVVRLAPHQTGYMQGEIELETDFPPSPLVTLGFNAVVK